MTRRKPKFKVGQVVCMWGYGYFVKITHAYECAVGNRRLEWWYKLMSHDQIHTYDNIREKELRPLTKRERGR